VKPRAAPRGERVAAHWILNAGAGRYSAWSSLGPRTQNVPVEREDHITAIGQTPESPSGKRAGGRKQRVALAKTEWKDVPGGPDTRDMRNFVWLRLQCVIGVSRMIERMCARVYNKFTHPYRGRSIFSRDGARPRIAKFHRVSRPPLGKRVRRWLYTGGPICRTTCYSAISPRILTVLE